MALTDDYTFVLGDTGVILNTDAASLPFVDIQRIAGLDNAPYRSTEQDHEGADGGFMDAEFEKGRTIVFDGVIYTDGTNMETYLDSLKYNWAPSRTLVPLYLKAPGVDERVLFVKPLGCRYDWEALRRIGSGNAQFIAFAEDPRIYSSALQSLTVTQGGTATTGRSYNKSYSYSYGAAITPDQTNAPVVGNRDTPVRFTMTGPVTNPTIVNDTEGVTLRFILNMGASDVLEVDTQYHTVYLNGASVRATLVEPNWFFLHPGDNFIRYTADSSGTSTLQVEYRSAWR